MKKYGSTNYNDIEPPYNKHGKLVKKERDNASS